LNYDNRPQKKEPPACRALCLSSFFPDALQDEFNSHQTPERKTAPLSWFLVCVISHCVNAACTFVLIFCALGSGIALKVIILALTKEPKMHRVMQCY
jgi:hypothetical protein